MISAFVYISVMLIQIVFSLLISLIIIRLVAQTYYGSNYYNQILYYIVRYTNYIVKPFQRITPFYKNIDFALIVVLILLQVIEILLLVGVQYQLLPNPIGVILWTIGALLNQYVLIVFYATIVRAILSWVNVSMSHPLYAVLFALTEPFLRPLRRIIPMLGMFDLSPLVLIILLQLISVFVFSYLEHLGMIYALGTVVQMAGV